MSLEATEMDIFDVPEEPKKKQARVVFELTVTMGMSFIARRSQLHADCFVGSRYVQCIQSDAWRVHCGLD